MNERPGDDATYFAGWWPEAADKAPRSHADLHVGGESMTLEDFTKAGGRRPWGSVAPAEVRGLVAAEASRRRNAEEACALDFIVYGNGDDTPAVAAWGSVVTIKHAERCVFGPRHACSRTYDPMPYTEAEPVDLRMYEGTAIGALYGMPGPALELEGWTLAPRTVFE